MIVTGKGGLTSFARDRGQIPLCYDANSPVCIAINNGKSVSQSRLSSHSIHPFVLSLTIGKTVSERA